MTYGILIMSKDGKQFFKREVIKMITRENAMQLVNEFESAKRERENKEANDFVDRIVSPKIEAQAKAGGHRIEITVAKGIDLSAVCKIIEDNEFSLMHGANPRDIVVAW